MTLKRFAILSIVLVAGRSLAAGGPVAGDGLADPAVVDVAWYAWFSASDNQMGGPHIYCHDGKGYSRKQNHPPHDSSADGQDNHD